MEKTIKYISVIFLFLVFFNSICFATDINMDLQLNEELEDTNITASTDITDEIVEQQDNFTTVTTTSTVDEDPFTISNIIDIFLIVVGIVLILLGLAILVRLKY